MKVWLETTDCRVSRDPYCAVPFCQATADIGDPKKEVENQVKVIITQLLPRVTPIFRDISTSVNRASCYS